MKKEISPRATVIIFAAVVVVVLGIAYRLFLTQETIAPPKVKKGQEYLLHPTGGEAYHNPQGLGLPGNASAGR